ncbi:hypothetical protein GXW82_31115 [Streptacidiphilus sp. 4-A2]|nr:hypothetical protein [Streptacidiphilus sp. 4-A2]
MEVGGPLLDLHSPVNHSNVPVGSTVSEPIVFDNSGTRPTSGVEALFMLSPGVDFTTRYRNCDYGTETTSPRLTSVALCSFSHGMRVGGPTSWPPRCSCTSTRPRSTPTWTPLWCRSVTPARCGR